MVEIFSVTSSLSVWENIKNTGSACRFVGSSLSVLMAENVGWARKAVISSHLAFLDSSQ
jgi:hypothetical protein